MPKWVPARKATRLLGVHINTLRNWDRDNKIETKRTPGNHRLFNVETFCDPEDQKKDRRDYIYARVSSRKQIADLERQIASMSAEYPQHKIIRDVGSGINWKRPGLKTLLRLCMERKVREVVVAHRDRLSRLAFDLIEFIVKETGGKLVVQNQPPERSSDEELGEDLLSIIHVFSCRSYGKRKYRKGPSKEKEKESKRPTPRSQRSHAGPSCTSQTGSKRQ